MTDLTTFVSLGLRHILDVGGFDHVLFLVALAAVYRLSDWRQAVWVVTAFTVGHSVSLAATVLGYLPLSQPLVEFLIPVTILATCVENIVAQRTNHSRRASNHRPLFAVMFGLVHGAGFGGYLKSLFVDQPALPLLGFNIGIEVGQVLALAGISATLFALDVSIRKLGNVESWRAHRARLVLTSALVMVVAAKWTAERAPW